MRGFKTEIVVGVSMIALGLSLPVIARAATPDGIAVHGEVMSAVDTNKDGKVSEAEWKAATDMRFSKSDTNGDGTVSREEMTAERDRADAEARKKRGDEIFKRADQDGNGKLSKAEYEALSGRIYQHLLNQKAVGAPPTEAE